VWKVDVKKVAVFTRICEIIEPEISITNAINNVAEKPTKLNLYVAPC
jgi:hypothetical protein